MLATDLVSSAIPGVTANGWSFNASLSADGRYVAFQSDATNLVVGDTNNTSDVFVKDLQTGEVTRVSAGAGGQGNSYSSDALISADGRFVAFSSWASNLVEGDTNNEYDVFVKDLETGGVMLVSANANTLSNGYSFASSISVDGRFVAFRSDATNLVVGDTNNTSDVFVKDMQTGEVTRVSAGAAGQGNSYSDGASISADGRFVAFQSDATNLVVGDTNNTRDVFVKDLQTGEVTLVSAGSAGQGNSFSYDPSISADGRFVAFQSDATNLVSDDTNNTRDVFVKDLQTGVITRVSAGAAGQGNSYSDGASISADGRFVAFQSDAGNLVENDHNGAADIFVKKLTDVPIVVASTAAFFETTSAAGDSSNPSVSTSGRHVAFESQAGNLVPGDGNGVSDIFVRDMESGQVALMSIGYNGQANGESRNATINADGRYVAFDSQASNLVFGDSNNTQDIFVTNLQTGTITLLTTAIESVTGNAHSSAAILSAEGRYLVFESLASNLVTGDTNHARDIFVTDLQTGGVTLVSDGPNGQANGHSHGGDITTSGRYVAFSSFASNLVEGDTNNAYDVFVKDLQTGAFTLVSAGSAGQGNSYSDGASISADGRFVAFQSDATNLVVGDTNNTRDVFVKDLQTGEVTLVSAGSAGQGNSFSYDPSISADGRFVAFQSDATNLVSDDTNNTSDVFVKDLQTGEVTRVSAGAAGQGNSFSFAPLISADGRFVAFASYASNLVDGDTNQEGDVFVKDLQTGVITLISVGPNGQGNATSFPTFMSADGRYVAFLSDASNLVDGDINGDYDAFIKDLQTGTITLASTSAAGQGNQGSYPTSISADGRLVAIVSSASNFVDGDTNFVQDVFVKNLADGTLLPVSLATVTALNSANGSSFKPSISADGRSVAFASRAPNLVAGQSQDFRFNIFVGDVQTGEKVLVSTGINGPANGNSGNASISAEGRYVAFDSYANNLVAGDTNDRQDVFVKDVQTGLMTLVSKAMPSATANNASWGSALSANGRYLVFSSSASNLVEGDTHDSYDIFVKDLQTGAITRAVAHGGGGGGSISADGRYLAFSSLASNLVSGDTNNAYDVFVKDLQTGAFTLVSAGAAGQGNTHSNGASISADGRYVAFRSDATNLVVGDTNNTSDVFVKDLQTGEVTRVSAGAGGQGNSYSSDALISADGRFVAFSSWASNLVEGDTNNEYDVFVKDLETGGVMLVSANANTLSNGYSFASSISVDGRFVAISSWASNLVEGDTNDALDVFVKDLQTGVITRVSAGAAGQGNRNSYFGLFSADGRYVAFSSEATNLVSDDTNNTSDVFVKDLETGGVMLVSANTNASSNGYSFAFSISADGRYVAFTSYADNLVADDNNLESDVFVKDLILGTITVVSTAEVFGSNSARGDSTNPSISANGRYVAFQSQAKNLAPGDTNGTSDIFVGDLQTGAITLVSVGEFGQGNGNSSNPSISADGRYVTFESLANNLVAGDTNHQSDVFVKDLRTGSITRLSTGASGEANGQSLNPAISSDGRYVAFDSSAHNLHPSDRNHYRDIFRVALVTAPNQPPSLDLHADSDNGIDNADNITSLTTLRFDGTAEADSTIRLYNGNSLLGTTTAVGGAWRFSNITLLEGVHTLHATATDAAGHISSSDPLTVVVDTTPPTATGVRTAANSSGWNNSSVTVDLSGSDALSGLTPANASQRFTFDSDGAGQDHTFTVSDRAGNTATFGLTDLGLALVNIDTVAPTLVFGATGANAAGWNRTDVTLGWTATDGLSGLAGPSSGFLFFSTETNGATQQVDVVDMAGNSQSFTSPVIRLDKSAPVSTAKPVGTMGLNGWYTSPVSVALSAADNLSGILDEYYRLNDGAWQTFGSPYAVTTQGLNSVRYYSQDVAGNIETTKSLSLKIDTDTPSITGDSQRSVQYSDRLAPIILTIADATSGLASAAIAGPSWVKLSKVSGNTWSVQTTSGVKVPPGNYTARVTAFDNAGLTSVHTIAIHVIPENADVFYTGMTYVTTASAGRSRATVVLSATIRDFDDAQRGDIRNATVSFRNMENNVNIATVRVSLINPTDQTLGRATYEWIVDIGPADGVTYTIGIVVNGHYQNLVAVTDTLLDKYDRTVITVKKPSSDSIGGGGHTVNTESWGAYAGSPGAKTNFGLAIKFNPKLTNLEGKVNIIVRSGSRLYQIKANAIDSLSISSTEAGVTTATFASIANVSNITDPNNPIALGGNAMLRITLTDRGEPGDNDSIGIELGDVVGNLLFSSRWSSDRTIEQLLGGGNLQVRQSSQLADAPAARVRAANLLGQEDQWTLVVVAGATWPAIGLRPLSSITKPTRTSNRWDKGEPHELFSLFQRATDDLATLGHDLNKQLL